MASQFQIDLDSHSIQLLSRAPSHDNAAYQDALMLLAQMEIARTSPGALDNVDSVEDWQALSTQQRSVTLIDLRAMSPEDVTHDFLNSLPQAVTRLCLGHVPFLPLEFEQRTSLVSLCITCPAPLPKLPNLRVLQWDGSDTKGDASACNAVDVVRAMQSLQVLDLSNFRIYTSPSSRRAADAEAGRCVSIFANLMLQGLSLERVSFPRSQEDETEGLLDLSRTAVIEVVLHRAVNVTQVHAPRQCTSISMSKCTHIGTLNASGCTSIEVLLCPKFSGFEGSNHALEWAHIDDCNVVAPTPDDQEVHMDVSLPIGHPDGYRYLRVNGCGLTTLPRLRPDARLDLNGARDQPGLIHDRATLRLAVHSTLTSQFSSRWTRSAECHQENWRDSQSPVALQSRPPCFEFVNRRYGSPALLVSPTSVPSVQC